MTTQRQIVQPAQVRPSSTGGVLQRACACGRHTGAGGECAECKQKRAGTLQRKAGDLIVGPTGDRFEQEAERVAATVVGGGGVSSTFGAPSRLQRRTTADDSLGTAPPIVHDVLQSPGQPLDTATRSFMEPRFGHDFSGVRAHLGTQAAESARAVNALAYTVGRDVVFGAGQHQPQSSAGQRLMAHELAHVVQQSGADGMHVSQSSEKLGLSPVADNSLLLRQPSSPAARTGITFITEFHPGIAHNHAPTGRWADIQKDAAGRCKQLAADIQSEVSKGSKADPKKVATASGLAGIECSCAKLPPEYVLDAARYTVMLGLSLAQKHLDHYITGGGVNFIEDIEDVVQRDTGVRSKLARAMKASNKGHIRVEQSDYAVRDFQYAFGAIDRLDFEVDKKTGLAHVWFMDRYEWHPVGFGYKLLAGDSRRETNCVHAAAVEMKASGAADYWMVGDAVIPLSLITSKGTP